MSPDEEDGLELPSTSGCKPVNSTLYRYSTLLAVKVLKRIRPREGYALMSTNRLCVKYASHVHKSEASTMRFISQHTSIPVPKGLCAFTHSERTYILMERARGEIIGSGWVKRSEESRTELLSQLKKMVREMRQPQPPEDVRVASVDDGSLYDCCIPGPSLRFGPFDTIQDFHRHLHVGMELDPRLDPEIQGLIKQQSKSWPLVFSHGDSSNLKILARGDDIVGIVD